MLRYNYTAKGGRRQVSELKTKKKAPKYKKRHHGATFLLPSPSAPRPRRWAGRYACFPHELKQVFDPIIRMHLERLKRGEIVESRTFIPKIGFLTLKNRDGEIWAIFINDLEYAKQRLEMQRKYAAAVQHGTIVKNPQGRGMWVFQPPVSILPLSLQIFLPASLLCKQQLVEFRQDPPWRVNSFNSNFSDERKQFVKSSCRWLTPSVPCAVRAPTPALPLAER